MSNHKPESLTIIVKRTRADEEKEPKTEFLEAVANLFGSRFDSGVGVSSPTP